MRDDPTDAATIRIPLRDRWKSIRAYARIDREDEHLLVHSWHLSNDHVCRSTNPGQVYLHREIMGAPIGAEVDHINGDPLDCRRSNLRILPPGGNQQNVGSRGGSSRFRGVSWDTRRRKWKAAVKLNGKSMHLGLFTDELEAARAASDFRRAHMPYANEDRVVFDTN